MKRLAQIFISLGIVLLITGALILAAAYVYLNHYLASDEFRNKVSRLTSEYFHVQGEYQPFNWSGYSVYSEGFEGRSDASTGAPSKIKFEQIRANLNFRALFMGTWQIDSIEVGKTTIDLRSPAPDGPVIVSAPEKSSEKDISPFARLLAPLLPKKVSIIRVSSENTNIVWPSGAGNGGSALGIKVACEPLNDNMWRIEGTGGKLAQPDFPASNIATFKLRYGKSALYITELELRHETGGSIFINGEILLSNDKLFDINAEFKGYPVNPFTPGDWRAKLTGGLLGKVHGAGRIGDEGSYRATGNVSLASGKVEGLPWFDQYESLLPTSQLRTMDLKKTSLEFSWTPAKLVMKKIWVESEGNLCIQGEITKEGQALDGQIDLGTTPSIVRKIPGAEKQVFVFSHDGYIWTPVKIGGTWPDFTEDLTPRLKAAAIQSAVDSAQGVINKAKGATEGAVDILKGLLNR